ncbi:unnamed protein product [Camellia sinensis]
MSNFLRPVLGNKKRCTLFVVNTTERVREQRRKKDDYVFFGYLFHSLLFHSIHSGVTSSLFLLFFGIHLYFFLLDV